MAWWSETGWILVGVLASLLVASWAHYVYWVRRFRLSVEYAEHERLRTADGSAIELRRLTPPAMPSLPPVLLVHGVAANHRNVDLQPDRSLARYLHARGRDVWLVMLRSGRPDRRWPGGPLKSQALAQPRQRVAAHGQHGIDGRGEFHLPIVGVVRAQAEFLDAIEVDEVAAMDADEGADILMVKPALPYLDVISRLRAGTDLPIAAYQVSGEYSMIRAAADRGWLDYRACMTEALLGISRAGADLIFSYAALDYARWSLDAQD